MTDIAELIERVRQATGPDREIDKAILAYLGFHEWAGRLALQSQEVPND